MRLSQSGNYESEGKSTNYLKFERIAGEGESALFALYIDGERIGDALTIEEVTARIAGAYDTGGVNDE